MFSFFRKSGHKEIKDYSDLGVDMHSHLLPGIDDGPKSMDEAVFLIRGLADLGYRKLITTPHVYKEFYPNSTERILAGLAEVRKTLQRELVDIEIEAAAEYFLDEHFEELLETENFLTFPGTKMVLVETSFFAPAPKLEEYIFNLRIKGYQPIIAHPERYTFWHHQPEKYKRLKDMDCLFQLNILSLSGGYGPQVTSTAEWLLKNNLIDFLGTDLHHDKHLLGLKSMKKSRTLARLLDRKTFRNQEL